MNPDVLITAHWYVWCKCVWVCFMRVAVGMCLRTHHAIISEEEESDERIKKWDESDWGSAAKKKVGRQQELDVLVFWF